MPRSLTVHAFAKINLDLLVLGLRPDGYHELRTTFQSIALADTLTFTQTRGPFHIECDDPAFPTDHSNLIWKAAVQVLAMARRRDPPFGIPNTARRSPARGPDHPCSGPPPSLTYVVPTRGNACRVARTCVLAPMAGGVLSGRLGTAKPGGPANPGKEDGRW